MRTKSKFWVSVLGLVLLSGGVAFAQAFNPITTFSPVSGSVIRQNTANMFAGKVTLATGVATVTFQFPYNVIPSCTATEESSAGHYPQISAISATAFTITSSVTSANSDVVDWQCIGNPN